MNTKTKMRLDAVKPIRKTIETESNKHAMVVVKPVNINTCSSEPVNPSTSNMLNVPNEQVRINTSVIMMMMLNGLLYRSLIQ